MIDTLIYWTGAAVWAFVAICTVARACSMLAGWWLVYIGAAADFVRFVRDRERKRRGEPPSRGAG